MRHRPRALAVRFTEICGRSRSLAWLIVLSAILGGWALAGTAQAATAASVKVTLSPASIIANGTSTTTATATITGAKGALLAKETKVAFSSSDPGDKVSATTNAGKGLYTATITSSTTVGTATITATDSTSTPAVSSPPAVLTQTAGPAATVTVALNPTSIVANGASTATATATVKDAEGHFLSSEAVGFSSSDPGELIGGVVNNHNGTYSVSIRSSTTVGTPTITASDGSVSGRASLSQTAGATSTSLTAYPSVVVTNETVTLVAVASSVSGPPVGTITFDSNGVPIPGCTAEPVTPSRPAVGCQASFAAANSPDYVTATFVPGPGSGAPGSTGATTVTVTPDSSSASLAVSPTVEVGHSTTYTATVAPPAVRPGPVEPSGSVEFFDNGAPITSCLAQGVVNGQATCSLTYKAAGTHTITARYSGSANFTASSSSGQTIRVTPLPPPPVQGIVTSPMQWSFYYTPTYTKVLTLTVNGASTSATVLVKCHGGGCPYGKRSTVVAKLARCSKNSKCARTKNVSLAPAFKNRHLHVGAQIAVEISRPHWIAKYYAFTIRARRGPKVQISCLAPGQTRPGKDC